MDDTPESSRIFVRGLPPKFTEDDVRKHFGKFTVTDVKFFPHRRIGYVGYKTPEDAAQAVKYFNKTFIRQSKIFVETARPVSLCCASTYRTYMLTFIQIADKALPKSRRQLKEENGVSKNDDYVPPPRDNALKRKRDEAENDPNLKEFLNVMQPPSKLKSWANEDSLLASESISMAKPVEVTTGTDVDSDGEYQVISKKTTATQDVKTSSPETKILPTHIVKAVKPADEDEEMIDMDKLPYASAGDGGPVSDADWLRSRTNRVLDLVEDGEGLTRPIAQPTTVPAEQIEAPDVEVEPAEPSKPNEIEVEEVIPSEEDKIRQTGRLYLRNLHFDITEDDIRDHFSKHGSLEEVRLFSPFLHHPTLVMMNSQDRDN